MYVSASGSVAVKLTGGFPDQWGQQINGVRVIDFNLRGGYSSAQVWRRDSMWQD